VTGLFAICHFEGILQMPFLILEFAACRSIRQQVACWLDVRLWQWNVSSKNAFSFIFPGINFRTFTVGDEDVAQCSFWQHKVYADIRRGWPKRGRQIVTENADFQCFQTLSLEL